MPVTRFIGGARDLSLETPAKPTFSGKHVTGGATSGIIAFAYTFAVPPNVVATSNWTSGSPVGMAITVGNITTTGFSWTAHDVAGGAGVATVINYFYKAD